MDNLNAERERKKKMATLNIVLKRASKTYKEGETIKGVVYVNSKGELSHNGLSLTVDGTVKLQLSARSVDRFEAFYNSLKPIHVLHQSWNSPLLGRYPEE